ncbi:MFS transporter [Microbacterium lacus]|uniref:MFS transporter n=1 Tax=Microbacterium lacus TaxID=415217 RepID=UPI000C2C59E0|nr:MFS transporter [Microbacterium lacus]
MSTSTAAAQTSAPVSRFPLRALLLLSFGVLVTVTAESLPAGLMPELSADLGVSSAQIGLLISVWALTVIVTSIPLTRATARFDRRLVIAVALAAFALANVATAFAPGYEFAFATRILAAIAHGAFWAVVMVYATALLSPAHLGRGLAIVTGGGTAATIIGLPLATLVAQGLGWRAAFVGLGAIALLLGAVVVLKMPPYLASTATHGERSSVFRDPSLPALAAFGIVAVLIATAQFASFTYIRPYLEVSASIEAGWAAGLLFVYGAAGLLGVVAAAVAADRYPRGSLLVVLIVLVSAFVALTVASRSLPTVIVALMVWGFALGAVFPLLQTILMRTSTPRTRNLAGAGIVVLFNLGIAAGPAIGAVVGGAESPTSITAASAVAILIAAGFALAGFGLGRRRDRRASAQ